MFMKAVDNIVKDTVVNSEIPKLTFLPCQQPWFIAVWDKFIDLIVEPDLNITALGSCIETMSSENECQALEIHACVLGDRDEFLQIRDIFTLCRCCIQGDHYNTEGYDCAYPLQSTYQLSE